jgi:hypothetical protein
MIYIYFVYAVEKDKFFVSWMIPRINKRALLYSQSKLSPHIRNRAFSSAFYPPLLPRTVFPSLLPGVWGLFKGLGALGAVSHPHIPYKPRRNVRVPPPPLRELETQTEDLKKTTRILLRPPFVWNSLDKLPPATRRAER